MFFFKSTFSRSMLPHAKAWLENQWVQDVRELFASASMQTGSARCCTCHLGVETLSGQLWNAACTQSLGWSSGAAKFWRVSQLVYTSLVGNGEELCCAMRKKEERFFFGLLFVNKHLMDICSGAPFSYYRGKNIVQRWNSLVLNSEE